MADKCGYSPDFRARSETGRTFCSRILVYRIDTGSIDAMDVMQRPTACEQLHGLHVLRSNPGYGPSDIYKHVVEEVGIRF